eukprot:355549-Chlamydomonas_euryale.AAC.3
MRACAGPPLQPPLQHPFLAARMHRRMFAAQRGRTFSSPVQPPSDLPPCHAHAQAYVCCPTRAYV